MRAGFTNALRTVTSFRSARPALLSKSGIHYHTHTYRHRGPIPAVTSSYSRLLAHVQSRQIHIAKTSNMNFPEESGMKRKDPPSMNGRRPSKHSKLNGDIDMEDSPPRDGVLGKEFEDDADEDLSTLSTGPVVATQDTAEWQATIEKVIPKVVSIHFCQTAPFDTEGALASEATGFIVDSEKGYIMTNRHVVGPGPFTGRILLDNHEEVDVYPVYRDPVHDFGILRFDPKAIKYMSVSHLQLRPDLAKVGAEIRVIGNDSGEKLSVLSGIISRLDRNAPEYEGYCDFNVCYIQAAASASGGSSGSPVVELSGNVVALQAGGRSDGAATDYFLPLDRPLRALECIKRGEPVTRGTIQTQWLLKPFDEARRLGLPTNWESEVRAKFPKETGMLVAEVVLPQGPAHTKIEEGDVLIKVNGEFLTQFTKLDEILDENVGSDVKLLLNRGGIDQEIVVTIGDLHSITPDRFVNVAGASFHDLSYQQARYHAVSIKGNGVYCASSSSTFRVEVGTLIQTVDNKPTPDLASFIEVMKDIPDRKRVVVTYKNLKDMHTLSTGIFYIDRHWHSKMTMAIRNDTTGLWDYKKLCGPVPPEKPTPSTGSFSKMKGYSNQAAVDVIRSFVRVSVTIPLKLDGYPWSNPYSGWGLVVDAEAGLVITSRAIVPSDLSDVSITIADSIIVDAKVVFLHPLQNYAIIQYDPQLVQAPVKSATLATKPIKQGEETIFFGFNQNQTPVAVNTAVSEVSSVTIPASATMPRYRAVNLDAVCVENQISERCGSGVLVDKDGTVQALWLTYVGDRRDGKDSVYRLGMATPALLPVLEQIKSGKKPNLHILNLETHPLQMFEARIRGVPDEWVQRVHSESDKHQLFMVRKLDADNPENGFQEGDIILTLNGQLVTSVADFDVMYNADVLDAVIVRKKTQMELEVPTVLTTDLETDRAVMFCGAIIQAPHHAVRQQISKLHSKVYCGGRVQGSPAYMYGLAPTNFITHVNGVSTQNLDEFVAEASKIPDNTYFRLKLMTFDNLPWVITMKKNEHYFPMQEFIRDGSVREGWKRITYEDGKAKEDEGDIPDGAEEAQAVVETME